MAARHVGNSKGDSSHATSMPAYSITPGNIVTPVEAFSRGITSGGPMPTPRGYNKETGEKNFPIRGGSAKKSNPLGAFGLGGKD